MDGNGKLAETENVIFHVSYRIITEILRMNLFLRTFATEHGDTVTDQRKRNAGYQALVNQSTILSLPI